MEAFVLRKNMASLGYDTHHGFFKKSAGCLQGPL